MTFLVLVILIAVFCVFAAMSYGLMRWSWRITVLCRTVFILGLLAGWIAILSLSALLVSSWPIVAFAMLVLLMGAIQSVAISRMAWLRTLCSGRRCGVPLTRLLEATRRRINPFDRTRLNRALFVLENGGSEAEALKKLYLPAGVKTAFGVVFAFADGLTETETRAAWQREQQILLQRARRGGHWLYLAVISGAGVLVVFFWSVYVLPVFRDVVEQWQEELTLRHRIGFPPLFVEQGPPIFVAVMTALFVVYCVSAGLGFFQYTSIWPFCPWRAPRPLWGMRLLPGLAAVTRQRVPIAAFVSAMRSTRPPAPLARALRVIEEAERQGISWIEALASKKYLGSRERRVLETAMRLGRLPWACDMTAEQLVRRWSSRQEMINSVVFPWLVALLGVLCATVPITVFATLAWLMMEA